MTDVTDATFTELVLERSMTVPVIVDLWAEWCGPCKTLGPVLEAAVAATGGRVELAKVDVDANPQIAQALRVQSIPAVFVAIGGKLQQGFIGAQPEAKVVAFVKQLVPDLDEVALLIEAGDPASLEQAVALGPDRLDAAVAYARYLLQVGRPAAAAGIVGPFAPHPDAEAILADAAAMDDALGAAFVAAEATITPLLDRVRSDDEARAACVAVLEALPQGDARTLALRKAFASRLY
jgi:putative thioredoxin